MFPEGSWEGRTVEFMHIKSIPVKFKREWKLAVDLQAALLLWGRVCELVYMQGCWPSNCFQRRGSWWIQMCGEHGSQEAFQRAAARRALVAWRGSSGESQTLSDTTMNLGLHRPKWQGVTSPRQPPHWGRLRPWSSRGGSASTGRREREREKKLTGPTNKAWSGMWGYAAPLFNKHLRNAQNLFHAFMLLFDSALQWTEPGPNHLISLVVYFSLLHLASLVCMSSCKCISMTQLTVLYWWVSLRNVTPLAKMWQVLGKPQKHAYKNHVRLGETEDNSTNGLQHLKNHNEEGFLSSVKLTFLCILF